ncbi:MAG: PilN domain-containing protein [Proteobacteria bacterium]|nr:PilN domain-containing protein [Pseudomonadota bacterium]MBU1688081.1 PilN domain-containing protein [Pseudomonadota bacterium]
MAQFQRINLVPRKPFSNKVRKVTPLILLILLVALAVGLSTERKLIQERITSIDLEVATIDANRIQNSTILAMKQALATELEDLARRRQDLVELVDKIEEIGRGKHHYSLIMNAISDNLPPTVRCNRITINGWSGVIEGTAVDYRSLPLMVNQLKMESGFRDVQLQNVEKNQDTVGGQVGFTITFELAQDFISDHPQIQ